MVKCLDKKSSLLYTVIRQVPRGPKVNLETRFPGIANRTQVKTMRSGRSAVLWSSRLETETRVAGMA